MPSVDSARKLIVQQLLTTLISQADLQETNEKVYHELGFSYTRAELLEEIDSETEVGQRFIQTLVYAATEENLPLQSYLLEHLP